MLFDERFWGGIASGEITLAFRRWKRPTLKTGGTLRSPGGFLAIDAVDVVHAASIKGEDARRAGYESLESLLETLNRYEGTLYRIEFHLAGEDPRTALRERDTFAEGELFDLRVKLARMDEDSAWTERVLRAIEQRPATLSTHLAKDVGMERADFKTRVRRLKALGLTESLKVGYRLSPRGQAYLESLG